MMQQGIHQRALPGAGPGVNHHSRPLIDGDQVLVFVEDVERDLFRRGPQRRTRQNLDIDDIASHDPLRLPGQAFIDVHAALIDQLLNASAAELRKT